MSGETKVDSRPHLDSSEFWRLCHDLAPFDAAEQKQIDIMSTDGDVDSISSDDSLKNLFIKKEQENNRFVASHANRINTQRIFDTIELIGGVDAAVESNGGAVKVNKIKTPSKPKQVTFSEIDDAKFDEWTNEDSMRSSGESSPSNADDLLLQITYNLQKLKDNIDEIDSAAKASDTSGDLIDFNDDDGGESVRREQVHCSEMGESLENREKQVSASRVWVQRIRDNVSG